MIDQCCVHQFFMAQSTSELLESVLLLLRAYRRLNTILFGKEIISHRLLSSFDFFRHLKIVLDGIEELSSPHLALMGHLSVLCVLILGNLKFLPLVQPLVFADLDAKTHLSHVVCSQRSLVFILTMLIEVE